MGGGQGQGPVGARGGPGGAGRGSVVLRSCRMSPHTNSEGQDGQMGHTVASNQPTTMHHCSNQTRQQARTPPPPPVDAHRHTHRTHRADKFSSSARPSLRCGLLLAGHVQSELLLSFALANPWSPAAARGGSKEGQRWVYSGQLLFLLCLSSLLLLLQMNY